MSNNDETCLLFVEMTVKKEEESAFNVWYEGEYIPAFVREVPGIIRCRRFVTFAPNTEGIYTYLTVYEFTDRHAIERGMEVMKSRETWRKAWKDWEHRAVSRISDNLFRTTINVPGPVPA
jgi:antibiotic biosynthesis monooxygenase (ABM) superfamily enzyme